MLFGGLITVPFWGYRTIPLATIDVMLADSPRVEYGDGNKITKEDIENARERDNKLKERLKSNGGIGANLSNQVNTNKFIQGKLKGG